MPDPGRDRLRELLDAVLDEDNHTLDEMAGDAFSSPFHFSRQLTRGAGEPPVTRPQPVQRCNRVALIATNRPQLTATGTHPSRRRC